MHAKNSNSFLERYTAAIYFAVTFLITVILGGAYEFTKNAFVSPQYAPAIGLVIICMLSGNWSAWRQMNWGTFKKPKVLIWMLTALLLPAAVILISSLIMSFLGSGFVPWKDTVSKYAITMVTAILGCVFEEIGWRGYLFPKLAGKHTMFYSSVTVGVLWGVWHCKFAYGILGFILFVLLITCFSILMAWIHIKTKGNLLCAILFHLGVNIGSVLFLQTREGVFFYGLTAVLCAFICIPTVLKNKNEFFNKEPLKTTPVDRN
jgi:membrane protease YdiL (CAAX protease family)